MPSPRKNERQKEFISRCIPIVIEEGTAKDEEQASAVCFSMWRKAKGLKNLADNEIEIFGEIGLDVFTDMVQARIRNVEGPLNVRINSRGGDFFEALGLFNLFNKRKSDVTMHIEGAAFSAAAFLLPSASKVTMTNQSLLMIHRIQGGMSGTLEDLQRRVELMQKAEEILINSFTEKTGRKREEIEEFLKNETFMGAQEAKEFGFVDEIIEGDRVALDVTNTQKGKVPESYNHLFKESKMSKLDELLNVAKELDLDLGENPTEETALNAFKSLISPPKEEPKGLPTYVRNIVRESRETKIQALVKDFKISKAQADEYIKAFCSDEHLNKCLDADGNSTDGFDTLVKVAAQNQGIDNGEVTGIQSVSLKEEENPLIKNARMRREAIYGRS